MKTKGKKVQGVIPLNLLSFTETMSTPLLSLGLQLIIDPTCSKYAFIPDCISLFHGFRMLFHAALYFGIHFEIGIRNSD